MVFGWQDMITKSENLNTFEDIFYVGISVGLYEFCFIYVQTQVDVDISIYHTQQIKVYLLRK